MAPGRLQYGVSAGKCSLRTASRRCQLTLFWLHSTFKDNQTMGVMKIQVGQLWKKDGTGDIYLVTRLYSEALHTMAVLRKSGAEGEAQIRVRVERAAKGQTIPGFSPAQEEESY
jgi:hypothetical protein